MPFLRIAGSPEVLAQIRTDGRRDQQVLQVDNSKPLSAHIQGLRNVLNLRGTSGGLEGHTLHHTPARGLGQLPMDVPVGQLGLSELWVEAPALSGTQTLGDTLAATVQREPRVAAIPATAGSLGLTFERRTGGPIYCTSVEPGGAAEKAGLRRGAVLLSADGQPLADVGDLQNAAAEWRATGQSRPFKLAWEPPQLTVIKTEPGEGLGLKFHGVEPTGLCSEEVIPGSACERAGIPPGVILISIDGREVLTADDMRDVVTAWRRSGRAVLEIEFIPHVVPDGDDEPYPQEQPAADSRTDSFWEGSAGGDERSACSSYFTADDLGSSRDPSTVSRAPPPEPLGGWQSLSPQRHAPAFLPSHASYPEWQDAAELRMGQGRGAFRVAASQELPLRANGEFFRDESRRPAWWGSAPRCPGRLSLCPPDRELPPQSPPAFVTVPVPVARMRRGRPVPCVVARREAPPDDTQLPAVRPMCTGYRGVPFRPGSRTYLGPRAASAARLQETAPPPVPPDGLATGRRVVAF